MFSWEGLTNNRHYPQFQTCQQLFFGEISSFGRFFGKYRNISLALVSLGRKKNQISGKVFSWERLTNSRHYPQFEHVSNFFFWEISSFRRIFLEKKQKYISGSGIFGKEKVIKYRRKCREQGRINQ